MSFTTGVVNDLGSVEDMGSTPVGTGVAPSGYDEFPTLSLPPGLIDRQGYKVSEVLLVCTLSQDSGQDEIYEKKKPNLHTCM